MTTRKKKVKFVLKKEDVRPIYEIAREISANWSNVYFGAKPYLAAMSTLTDITDNYGMESASSIVNYFLCNATTWKLETARRVKQELKAMVAGDIE